MKTALVAIAKSINDILGVVGAESLLLRSIITKYWINDASELADRVISACIDETTGEVRPEAAVGILAQYRLRLGDDFIEKVIPEMAIVINAAYDKGRSYLVDRMMSGVFLSEKKISDDVIANLAYITGSKKTSIYNTLSRWFRDSQGRYLEKFIIPETARLMSYADSKEGNIATMRAIGKRYREFVKADGYWSAVSEYNVETAKIFSQVQLMQEMHITSYRIEAVLDPKTCSPCEWLHGTEWEVTQAVERMNEMLIAEEENVRDVNPFPTRQDPKNQIAQESNYFLPPYHPRCRCNIVTTSSVTLAPRVLPSSGGVPIKPTDKTLSNIFTTHVAAADDVTVTKLIDDIAALSGEEEVLLRVVKKAEYNRMKDAFNGIPYELRKWAIGNKKGYHVVAIKESSDIPSRVMGNVIQINEKYLRKGVNPAVIQHELRHALINPQIISSRKGARGAESLLDSMIVGKKKFKLPIHVNNMYKLNGGRGAIAAEAAVDEFMAMIGDYYKPGMSFSELVEAVREIEVEGVIGSMATDFLTSARWTAAEAKKAVQLWWDWSDIDNYTLLSKKQLLAKMAHKPSTAAIQRIALENEIRLKDLLRQSGIAKSQQLGDNEPFDVWIGGNPTKFYSGPGYKKYMPKHVIEVKTIVRAKNDKITMHKDSLWRKTEEMKKFSSTGTVEHTIVFDDRTGKIYYRQGLGSFRITSMREVTENELVKIFGGKVRMVEEVPDHSLKFNSITTKKQFTDFSNAMNNVKKEHREYLTWYSWEEYKNEGVRLYLAEDGSTGYGITKDGTLISLFSVEGKHNGAKAIRSAIENGATNLECFDGKLPTIYSRYGFTVVERYSWDDSLAPATWNYEKFGKPDFVVMKKGPIGKIVQAPSYLEEFPVLKISDVKSKKPFGGNDGAGINTSFIIKMKTGKKGKLEKYLYKPIDGEKFLIIDTIDEVADGGMSIREFVSWVGGPEVLEEEYGFKPDALLFSSIGSKKSAKI